MLGTINDVLMDYNTVTDYTNNGKCSKCGNCCSSILPVSEKELSKIKKYIDKHKIKVTKALFPTTNETIDCTCTFLNSNKECSIYEVRPLICKSFTCKNYKHGIVSPALLRQAKKEQMGVVNMRKMFKESEE